MPLSGRVRRQPSFVRRVCHACGLLLAVLLPAVASSAQVGEPVVEVVVEQEGQPVTDPVVVRLAGALAGRPLAMAAVSETIRRLMSLNRFDDVRPHAEPVPGGVRIRFDLVPLYPVDRVEFRGMPGLPERDLRRLVTERFGEAPGASRLADVAEALRTFYRQRGFPEARVEPSIEVTHASGRAALVLHVESGPRARVSAVSVQQIDPPGIAVPPLPGVRVGLPYDGPAIDRQLDAWVDRQRSRAYYEARATHAVEFSENGADAAVTYTVELGPRVTVLFSGDSLPVGERNRLVPIRDEGSADEDLLEDSSFAIEAYLFAQGYRDASVTFTRAETPEELTITFTIARGARHVVAAVRFEGRETIAEGELQDLLRVRAGDPFVRRTLEQGVALIRAAYRAEGHMRVQVEEAVEVLPPPRPGDDRPVEVVMTVTEGPRTIVREIAFEGVTAFDPSQLEARLALARGEAYSEVALRGDRDFLEFEYRNLGYEEVVVVPDVRFGADDTAADVRFVVREGPQILVDYVIIVGNERTSTATIERELLLRPGQPLGYAALIESRSRLIALGLFRRVQIEPLAHGAGPLRDVLVQVEEAPVYTFGFGGGLEGGFRLRSRPDGTSAEQLEVAPRGFFEIGRRNLWGKNRSINLFSRVSLRSRDIGFGELVDVPAVETSYGFNEYRVLLTYREPRVFGTAADVLVSGIFDQAIRTSFNFITRELRAEAGWRISRRYSTIGRYTVRSTELFDERFPESDKPLIDRIFPQVRTSKFAGSVLRDTRDDLLDPSAGTFVVLDADLAARAIGSEVGFVKSYLQGFAFRRLPVTRRTVLALGARIGAAHGFPRSVIELDEEGAPVTRIVQDLPANERFFAGGDTSVRGFSLDRLGSEETISPLTGFPTGGNAVLIFNAEMRVALFGALQGIGFVDAGNVFARPRSMSLLDLRPSLGIGLWYGLPFGPVRLDLGFNPSRRELVPGQRERGYVVHLALGPAF